MTALAVIKFKNDIYCFADGQATYDDDFIFSKKVNKVSHISDSLILLDCGEGHLITSFKELLSRYPSIERLNNNNVSLIQGNGTIVAVLPNKVRVFEFNREQIDPDSTKSGHEQRNSIEEVELDVLPIFFGSGRAVLAGAIEAQDLDECKYKADFINKVEKAFKVTSSRVSSVGELYKYSFIKASKL